MTFVAGAVIWSGYTLAWWGWLALTDRVPPGTTGTFWWPSIKDLVVPGNVGRAVPPRLIAGTAGSATTSSGAQGVDAAGNPLTGTPGKAGGAPLQTQPQPGKYGGA